LVFRNPISGKMLRFTSPLPESFNKFLR